MWASLGLELELLVQVTTNADDKFDVDDQAKRQQNKIVEQIVPKVQNDRNKGCTMSYIDVKIFGCIVNNNGSGVLNSKTLLTDRTIDKTTIAMETLFTLKSDKWHKSLFLLLLVSTNR